MNEQQTDFVEFPKMARLSRECIITEKIDGTNAQLFISPYKFPASVPHFVTKRGLFIIPGSRTRYLTLDDDNYGFARWVLGHLEELGQLGHGRHFGEWWGGGIQRGYGLAKNDQRFSLFNVSRWCLRGATPQLIPSGDPTAPAKYQDVLPACVGLVPVLFRGIFNTVEAEGILQILKRSGSQAVRGYQSPEGIVVWHTAANIGFKKTIEKDESPKSLNAAAGRWSDT